VLLTRRHITEHASSTRAWPWWLEFRTFPFNYISGSDVRLKETQNNLFNTKSNIWHNWPYSIKGDFWSYAGGWRLNVVCFSFLHPLTLRYKAFFFLVGLGSELRASHLQSRCSLTSVTPPVHFASGYFGDWGVSRTICQDWSWTMILLISTCS
jgi:hypothetical protein